MQFTPQKKRTFLIIVGAIVLISLTVFFLVSSWEAIATRRAADAFEKYLFNDFNIANLAESGRGAPYDHYLSRVIESNIRVIGLEREDMADFFQDIDLEKYEKRAKEAESLFLTQREESLEEYHPLWTLMPYCMAQWANRNAQDIDILEFKEQISENLVFVKALEYWRDYFDKKDWQEENLSTVLGIVISESLCGDMQNINVENWSKKTIEVEIGAIDLSEKMRHSSEKIQILINLHGRINQIAQMPPYERLEEICIMPSEKTILTGDVCDAHYYYRNKRFCLERGWTEYDRIGKYLKERHSNPEKLICQIGLLRSFRGYFQH
jgi:hypothetical protein